MLGVVSDGVADRINRTQSVVASYDTMNPRFPRTVIGVRVPALMLVTAFKLVKGEKIEILSANSVL